MNLTSAYRELGYELASPRQDWSVEGQEGVCISLWVDEIQSGKGMLPWIDTQQHSGDISVWGTKPGNKKRRQHLASAVERYNGFVDAVLLYGSPGGSVKDAAPWQVRSRGGRWRIIEYHEESGHFRAEVQKI